ncbi:hypothetical protein CYMTET_23129 [Cymbomonas tetramitiformis]|uniref:Uncharacterized protein n=1 Tax=Cymbomonas tetramitiformis TaxID=36881 RepID=A0AAE0L193_9CHLO|nr:hypothetical protein CYMTET_23129 [Cymbomonas tetramitiformis]
MCTRLFFRELGDHIVRTCSRKALYGSNVLLPLHRTLYESARPIASICARHVRETTSLSGVAPRADKLLHNGVFQEEADFSLASVVVRVDKEAGLVDTAKAAWEQLKTVRGTEHVPALGVVYLVQRQRSSTLELPASALHSATSESFHKPIPIIGCTVHEWKGEAAEESEGSGTDVMVLSMLAISERLQLSGFHCDSTSVPPVDDIQRAIRDHPNFFILGTPR